MSTTDIDGVIETALAATGKYAAKVTTLQKDLGAIAQTDEYARLKDVLKQYINEGEKLQVALREVLEKAVELEAIQVRQDLYSERWWRQKQLALHVCFARDPQDGLDQWLQTYADALIAWEIAACKKLLAEPFPFPSQFVDVLPRFGEGTFSIENESFLLALDMLTCLVQYSPATSSRPLLDAASRATLLVFMGRISLYKASDAKAALKTFEAAKALAPDVGLPYAGLGNYYQSQHDSNQSLLSYQRAIELSPKSPDGYTGMGLLSEEQKSWSEATDWYDEAIEAVQDEKDPAVALSKLLTPTSGIIYYQLAKTLCKKNPERALQVVERAITMGIKHDADYPVPRGYRLKGEILEDLGRNDEATEAHFEAARRFGWQNDFKNAAKILRHANALNPDYMPIYWELADDLRLDSYRPAPEYADIHLVNESLEVWQRGNDRKALTTDYAMAYVVRALINEPRTLIPAADRWTLWWEAIAYIERALLINDTIARYWGFLSRLYRNVEAELTTLSTTAKALELDPQDSTVLEERTYILANTGQMELAGDVIDTRFKLQPNPDLKALKAFVFFYKKAYREALQLLDEFFTELPEEKSYRDLRAYCYQMLDEWPRAQQEFEWILHNCKEPGVDDRRKVAWAAYNLNDLDRAIDIYKELCNEPTEEGNAYRSLGLCYLAKGDLAFGKQSLDRGIELAINLRELYDLLDLDIYQLERSSPIWSENARRNTLDEIKKKISDQRTQLEQRRLTVEDELKKVIENNPRKEGENNWPWIGAHAGLARYYLEQQRWNESAMTYLLLQDEGECFPEAKLGLEKAFDGLQAEGDTRVKEDEPSKALEKYSHILTLELLPTDTMRQAGLYSRLAFIHFVLADMHWSREYFVRAMQLYRENGIADPGGALGEICHPLLRDATTYWALTAQAQAILEQPGVDETLRSDLAAVRKVLANSLDELYKLAEHYVNSSELSPSVTPVILEIAQGLIPENKDDEGPLIKTYIPEMRERIQNRMGIKIPGVRVRDSSTLRLAQYTILQDEVPVAVGSAALYMRYCPISPETLIALGMPQASLIPTPHPLTGEPGCWVQQDGWELISSKNLELWAEPLVFCIYHLEAVLLQNLTDFIGIQELENLLMEWRKDNGTSLLIETTLPDQHAKYRYVQVLRALLRDHVPLTHWKDILTVVHESRLLNVDVSEAVRRIRLRLKRDLLGNKGAKRLELPAEWEDALVSGLGHENGKTFFTVPPQETHEMLTMLRKVVPLHVWNFVLVTRSSELRPFIQRLVEYEFPNLVVMSKEEMLTPEELIVTSPVEVGEQAQGVVSDAQ